MVVTSIEVTVLPGLKHQPSYTNILNNLDIEFVLYKDFSMLHKADFLFLLVSLNEVGNRKRFSLQTLT